MIEVSSRALWELTKHIATWVANLSRAHELRQKQSINALRKVILASRETTFYLSQYRKTQQPNPYTEKQLSLLWTELGFELSDLNLDKLAERCQQIGRSWANPKELDFVLLSRVQAGLYKLEKTAEHLLKRLDSD